ncbi:MAG: CTP synthase, partial [Oscillospiraceae bacterium]
QLEKWEGMVKKAKALKNTVQIGLVGKYIALQDAYLSVVEALRHAGVVNNVDVCIKWIDSSLLTEVNAKETLKDCEGIIVPGGFGQRGIEGMVTSIKYARENNIPFFGICLGMQMAVLEFARNVLKLNDVNSTEFDRDCQNPVIDIMASQENLKNKGGTMRLGLYPCKLIDGAKVKDIYKQELIYERHRHRYEFNNSYRKLFEESGMTFCGISPDERLVEIIELPKQKWFIATQFHPEFKSRLDTPHPLFVDFIKNSKQ